MRFTQNGIIINGAVIPYSSIDCVVNHLGSPSTTLNCGPFDILLKRKLEDGEYHELLTAIHNFHIDKQTPGYQGIITKDLPGAKIKICNCGEKVNPQFRSSNAKAYDNVLEVEVFRSEDGDWHLDPSFRLEVNTEISIAQFRHGIDHITTYATSPKPGGRFSARVRYCGLEAGLLGSFSTGVAAIEWIKEELKKHGIIN